MLSGCYLASAGDYNSGSRSEPLISVRAAPVLSCRMSYEGEFSIYLSGDPAECVALPPHFGQVCIS